MGIRWKARAKQLEQALIEARVWHYSEDKALSKYPPNSDSNWRRMQHREQMDEIDAIISQPPHSKAKQPINPAEPD